MSRLTRDGTAEPVSRDQILRHARGQGNVHFPCSADHEQDWQPYPVDPYSAICDDHTYIHTYSAFELLLGTWPCACYQRVDVLSQLFDSSLHVGFRNYQSSPTRRARTENKKVNDHSRSSVNTREVSEGSMGEVSP